MSSEVVKKRGRPKKVISDPIEVEVQDNTKKSTTRAKSTKAAPKVVKAKTTVSATKNSPSDAPAPKAASSTLPAAKTASKSPSSIKAESKTPTPAPSKTTPRSPLTPETSKILSQVRELSTKKVPTPADPSKSSKPLPTSTPSKAPAQSTNVSPPPLSSSKSPSPSAISRPTSSRPTPLPNASQTPPAVSKPAVKIPLAALNSEIVSNISSRAGARPNPRGGRALPPNYKPVARKVTMAIVAMPIAIVTSWVLYQRLVLGEDQKQLVKPGLTMVETPEVQDSKREGEETVQS